MSKKRLYEIAKEVGKPSKEIVAYAQSLGLEVKSHSSSVEESDAKRIVANFSAPKKVEKAPQKINDKNAVAKPAAERKEAPKAQKAQPAPATQAKPQSRNFKAEREAKAREQEQRRQNNRRNDRRADRGERRDNRNQKSSQNRNNRPQNGQNRFANNRQADNRANKQAGGRIDFKARAAALKAEQNA